MNSRTIDVVTDWETVAVSDGYEGLHELADAEFSGAVSAGTTWAFFLNGSVVGVFEGGMGDFEDAAATAYRATDPSLPLLFAMQEQGGDTRARYYTNETPLSDVDQTLSSGGFTGYIELSENVLSGDYYVVYHGGKSMSAAFVGNSERLLTGDEAFETADDEVGIYEVVDVDIELVEIPEPTPAGATDDADGDASDDRDGEAPESGDPTIAAAEALDEETATATGETEPGSDAAEDDIAIGDQPIDAAETDGEPSAVETESEAGSPRTGTDTDSETTAATAATAESDDPGEETGTDGSVETGTEAGERTAEDSEAADSAAEGPEAAERVEATGADDSTPDARADEEREVNTTQGHAVADAEGDPVQRTEPAIEAAAGSEPGPTPDTRTADGERAEGGHAERPTDPAETTPEGTVQTDASSAPDAAVAEEERWRNARTIPSLDPERSSNRQSSDDPSDGDTDRRTARERAAKMQRQRTARRAARDGRGESSADGTTADPPRNGGHSDDNPEDVERLRRRLSRARDRVESLEAERDELEAERETLRNEREERRERIEELETEREEYRQRIQELETECENLRAEVERLESEVESAAGGVAGAETTSMSPDRALSGTNLFVRYNRKGEATLKHAHEGDASRSDVAENLRLEHHTTFETDGVVVDDQPYKAFLHESTEYAFAEWVVSDLLYEIGETGNRTGLAGVFDVIPNIDRIELYGTVGVETDDGVERRDFDVICRDKMGDPLFVADINASRNATTETMVGSLVENTGTVAEHEETLAAGFYVTESFYEPGALETVAEETDGGILSRSNKRSYVKLSRKRGYHLCLVEARDGEFHLNVPDL